MKNKQNHSTDNYFAPLPTRIRELRASLGITQADLGKCLGVTSSNIGYYESGAYPPPTDMLCKLAKKFQVSTDYLLGLSDVKSDNYYEKQICDYLGLDTDSVRYLSKTKDNTQLHQTINFFFADRTLLSCLSHFSWARMDKIVSQSIYADIAFFDESILYYYDVYNNCLELERSQHADIIFYLKDFRDKLFEHVIQNPLLRDSLALEFIEQNFNCSRTLQLLLYAFPQSDILKLFIPDYETIYSHSAGFEDLRQKVYAQDAFIERIAKAFSLEPDCVRNYSKTEYLEEIYEECKSNDDLDRLRTAIERVFYAVLNKQE